MTDWKERHDVFVMTLGMYLPINPCSGGEVAGNKGVKDLLKLWTSLAILLMSGTNTPSMQVVLSLDCKHVIGFGLGPVPS